MLTRGLILQFQPGRGDHDRVPTGWLKNSSCVKLSGFSRDTFSRRRIPWCEERIPGRIRSKLLVLGPDAEELPRFFLPDVQAFMMSPRMRSALEFVPVFTVPSAAQDNSFHTPTADEPVVVPVCWRIEKQHSIWMFAGTPSNSE